jgi:RHS repeat-associated protein
VVDNRDSTQSRFYFYDDLDRLRKTTNLSGTPLFTYTHDANGNRTQQVAPGGTTTYSYTLSTDRIAQATGAAAKHYAHDAYGNRIWAGPTAYAGQSSHVYDQGNRLVEVRDPVTQAVLGQYTYDAAGRRVRKIAGGVTTIFFYDLAGHLVESQNLSTSPATRRTYVFVEDEPMGVVDQPPSGPPVFSWIHTDRLGTPLAVTSTPASGPAKTIWRATYEPFGLATPDEDPDGDSQAFALDLRFPGQVFDAESGVHDNAHRTYDPATGRYLSTDPIGQFGIVRDATGTPDENLLSGDAIEPASARTTMSLQADSAESQESNLYQYALDDPLNSFDTDGLRVEAPPTGEQSLPAQWSRWLTRRLRSAILGGSGPGSPPDPAPPYECSREGCGARLVVCLENKWWLGYELDCSACFRECVHAGGRWPSYKCPLPN